MSRWPRGEAEIESLIAAKQLQQVIGGTSQRRTCATEGVAHRAPSGRHADRTPTAPKFFAYDAARYAGTAILAHQGAAPNDARRPLLRPGGYACQFGRRVPALGSNAATTQRTRVPK